MKVADNKRNIITTFTKGDIFSKLSYVVFGLANIKNGQVVKGLIFLAMEILYIAFMAMTGSHNLAMMRTLGQNTQGMTYNESLGIYEVTKGDNSMLILLSGVVTLVITGFFLLQHGSFQFFQEREQGILRKWEKDLHPSLRM